jgi:hypothetical protein
MLAGYYLLVGGAVNEIFLRVAVLRAVASNVPNSPVVGMTHFWVMVFFVLLGAYFNIRYRKGGSRTNRHDLSPIAQI